MSTITGIVNKPALDLSGYTYVEVDGSPEIDIGESGINVTRTWQLPWAQCVLFAQALVGYGEVVGSDYVRYSPHSYTPQHGNAFVGVYVRRVVVKGYGKLVDSPADSKVCEYELGRVTAYYSTDSGSEPDDDGNEVRRRENFEASAEFLTITDDKLFFGTGSDARPLKETERPSVLMQQIDFAYTVEVDSIPDTIIEDCNKVNDAAITSKVYGITFPKESLMMVAPRVNRIVNSDGTSKIQLTLQFKCKPDGWNVYPNLQKTEDDGVVLEAITDGTNVKKFYKTASLLKYLNL